MTTNFNNLAWKIPWTEEPGELQSMESKSRTWLSNCAHTFISYILHYTYIPHHIILYMLYICVLSCFSNVWLLEILWTVAHKNPLSMRFSRQEYWIELLFPPPEDLSDPGIKPRSPASQEPHKNVNAVHSQHIWNLWLEGNKIGITL